jgi:hypothetical protein
LTSNYLQDFNDSAGEGFGEVEVEPFCLHFSFNLVKTRLHTKNQLLKFPGSVLKFCMCGICGIGVEGNFGPNHVFGLTLRLGPSFLL